MSRFLNLGGSTKYPEPPLDLPWVAKLSSKMFFSNTGGSSVVPARSVAAPPKATQSQDHSALVAMETENLRKEYEAKLADMKSSYEAELMSKQKLQEEMERLQNDYNRKVHNVEEHYGSTTAGTTAAQVGVGRGGLPVDSTISLIALANDLVS